VAFTSNADLTVDDHNALGNVFVHDRQLGLTIRAGVGLPGTFGERGACGAYVSPDGHYVTFSATSDDLVGQGREPHDTYVFCSTASIKRRRR
jgi:hypothetical protein